MHIYIVKQQKKKCGLTFHESVEDKAFRTKEAASEYIRPLQEMYEKVDSFSEYKTVFEIIEMPLV